MVTTEQEAPGRATVAQRWLARLALVLAADGLVTTAPLHWPKGSTWLLQRTAPRQVRAAIWRRWPLAAAWTSASAAPVIDIGKHAHHAAAVAADGQLVWAAGTLGRVGPSIDRRYER